MSEDRSTSPGIPVWLIIGALVVAVILIALAFSQQQQAATAANDAATAVVQAQQTATAGAQVAATQVAQAEASADARALALQAEATADANARATADALMQATATVEANAQATTNAITQATATAESRARQQLALTSTAQADTLAAAAAVAEATAEAALALNATIQASSEDLQIHIATLELAQATAAGEAAALAATTTAGANAAATAAAEQAALQATLDTQAAVLAANAMTLTAAADTINDLTQQNQANGGAALAVDSLRLLHQDYPLALLLGVEASRRRETASLGDALFTALRARPEIAAILQGHSGTVYALAFSPDGRWLASGGLDTRVILWDTTTHQPVGPLLADHADSIFALAFSPDGQTLASGGPDGTVVLWDVSTGERIGSRLVHDGWVNALAFSPDGALLAAGGTDDTVTLWALDSGQPVAEPLAGHTNDVRALAFSPDGTTLASGSADQTVILWNVAERSFGRRFTGHTGWVNSVAFSPDGKTLVSGGGDKQVILWDVRSGQPRGAVVEPLAVTSVAFSPDGSTVAAVSNAVTVWDVTGARPQRVGVYDTYAPGLWNAVFSPDGLRLAAAGADNTVMLWAMAPFDPLAQQLDAQSKPVRAVTFDPRDASTLASSSEDGTIAVWDTTTGSAGQTFTAHAGGVFSLVYSPVGHMLASGGEDGLVRIWDAASSERLAESTPKGHDGTVLALAYSPDGRLIASGGGDGRVLLWDAASGAAAGGAVEPLDTTVWSVAFSADGRSVFSASDDGQIRQWDAVTGEPQGDTMTGHNGQVFVLAVSPDGQTLASGGGDGRVIFWDIRTHQQTSAITAHTDSIFALAFSPDGALLATGGPDGIINLWDVATGQPVLRPFAETGDWVNALAFSPDGAQLAAGIGSQNQTTNWVARWDLRLPAWQAAACGRAGRNLSLAEWQRYFPDSSYQRTCPDLPAHPSVIEDTVNRAEVAASVGDDETAGRAYALAAEWLIGARYPDLSNSVCWFGTLYGFVETVQPVCERMVELVPDNGNLYDSRGVARALTGDLDGALADFRVFVAWAEGRANYEPYIERRLRWITQLAAGENPIDEAELRDLLNE